MARSTIGVTPGSGLSIAGFDHDGDGYTVQGVSLEPSTGGGASQASYVNAATANQDSTVVKAAAGTVYALEVSNNNAAVRYLKLYDKATAPTSADTPVRRFRLNAGAQSTPFAFAVGLKFANGIAFRITTGVTDADTGTATANDHLVNLSYA